MSEKPSLVLDLTAVKAAFEMFAIPRTWWPELCEDILFLFNLDQGRVSLDDYPKDLIDGS